MFQDIQDLDTNVCRFWFPFLCETILPDFRATSSKMSSNTWTDVDDTWEHCYQNRLPIVSPKISMDNAEEFRTVHEKLRRDLVVLQTLNGRCFQWYQIECGLDQLQKVAQNFKNRCEARIQLQQERSRNLNDLDRSESAQDNARTQKLVNELASVERRLKVLRFQGDDGKAIRPRIRCFGTAVGLAFEKYEFSSLTNSICLT